MICWCKSYLYTYVFCWIVGFRGSEEKFIYIYIYIPLLGVGGMDMHGYTLVCIYIYIWAFKKIPDQKTEIIIHFGLTSDKLRTLQAFTCFVCIVLLNGHELASQNSKMIGVQKPCPESTRTIKLALSWCNREGGGGYFPGRVVHHLYSKSVKNPAGPKFVRS